MVTIEKDKDILLLVENTIDRLNIVKENAQKENKQIVSDLAKALEGIIPMDTICMEIVLRLHGHLSPRTIRKYLDLKYKIKSKASNARKQKKKISCLAAQGPLNNAIGRVVVNERNDISFLSGDNKQPFQPSENSTEDSSPVGSLPQEESSSSTEQKQPCKAQINSGLTECHGCIDKEERIEELEEALQKIPQFIDADKVGSSAVASEGLREEPEEPLEFEVSKKEWEIRNYMNQIIFPSRIWFNGRIDRKSGKIIYFGLGRLDQLHQKSVPNRCLD